MLFLTLLGNFVVATNAWTKARDERMPGELRFANEGLTHDDNYWYLTNKHFIYKVNKQPMTIVQSNHQAIPQELKDMGYDHIGDVEVYEDVLYGGIEGGSSTGILARWNTSTLEIINYKFIDEQRGVPWVTVNPETGYLYASEWNNMDVIHVYDTANQEFPLVEKLTIATPETYPKEIQGASFYQGDLYLATNIEDSIYRINVTTGVSDFVFSDNESYLIDKYYYEMEGLTFWDLSADGLGVMHMYGNFMNVREKAIHSFSP